MAKAPAMLFVLLAIGLMAANTSAAFHRCCRGYIRYKLRLSDIIGYSVQTVKEMCPINAIIFHTNTGKKCTNPTLSWVMDYVNNLRSKAQRVHLNNVKP